MRLTWYILRMHIGPFLFGTFAVVFLFLLQFIFKYLNDLVGKGLSYFIIAEFIIYNLAWMLVLAVPMGVLVSSLMAYGKLSGSNELTVIKSSGGSAFSAMIPGILGGLAMFIGLYLFNDKILPETNHKAYVLQNDIKQLKPTFAIDPGRFSTMQGYSILARDVDREENTMDDVTIYGRNGSMLNVINANHASMAFNQDFSRLVMTMYQGEVHRFNRRDLGDFRKFSFDEYRITIKTSGYDFNPSDPDSYTRTDRTMDIAEMGVIADTAEAEGDRAAKEITAILWNEGEETPPAPPGNLPTLENPQPDATRITRPDAATAAVSRFAAIRSRLETQSMRLSDKRRRANQFRVEIHKKYSIPAACLLFVFVGAPLGILVRRGNFGVSATIALGFFIVYWACLVSGEKLADRDILSPAVAMWMANGLIGTLGVYLTILVSRETVTFRFDFERFRNLFRRKNRPPVHSG